MHHCTCYLLCTLWLQSVTDTCTYILMSNIFAYGWDSSGSALSNWSDGSRTIAKWFKVCDPNLCSLWCCGSVKEKKKQPRDSLFGMNTGGSALYLRKLEQNYGSDRTRLPQRGTKMLNRANSRQSSKDRIKRFRWFFQKEKSSSLTRQNWERADQKGSCELSMYLPLPWPCMFDCGAGTLSHLLKFHLFARLKNALSPWSGPAFAQ